MTVHHHPQHRARPKNNHHVDLTSAAALFIAIVAISVSLIGIAVRGTTPFVLILPTLLGCWAILTLRR